MIRCYFILVLIVYQASAYTRYEFTIASYKEEFDRNCTFFEEPRPTARSMSIEKHPVAVASIATKEDPTDPLNNFENVVHNFLFGSRVNTKDLMCYKDEMNQKKQQLAVYNRTDPLEQYPTGNVMRAETFANKSAVHLPPLEMIHRGHCRLEITRDMMQTALNAFAILLGGNVVDVLALPADYVLRSARTIAMMKIRNEKLMALWTVVKGNRHASQVSVHELEMFRPLFKYVNGREIARLNLSDDRIIKFIGTHPDLDRHQISVVASQFVKIHADWKEQKYLNLLNNIICGLPIQAVRNLPSETYLQLPHQTFYHIRACDSIQRRYHLGQMLKTEAVGKPYSWDSREVSRLGLLLTEVTGPQLALINPPAAAGITAHVMMHLKPCNIKYFTPLQISNFGVKTFDIFTKHMKLYEKKECLQRSSAHIDVSTLSSMFFLIIIIMIM